MISKPACDDQILIALLRDDCEDLSHIEHLESCVHCQQRLEELAAEKDIWIKTDLILSKQTRIEESSWDFTAVFNEIKDHVETKDRRIRSVVSSLLSPPSHPEMLGRIGRYEVERCIGIGGMGVVFKAIDTELNRPVAVKVLSPHLSDHPTARARFAREARAAAAVVHEHVVPIYNVETEGQQPYLVMHLVSGESLQERIDRVGPLELREILRIGSQIALGLHAAHQQGLIHRDIKPANVLLENNVDRALITDFGLARTADDASLTITGSHLGTPQFMSPEQASNSRVDARSDLFSFGSLLYNMCTGKPPFQATTSLGVLRQIVDTEPPSIVEFNPLCPPWLSAIVGRLMAKQPDDRFADAKQVAELLTGCLAHVQQPNSTALPSAATALLSRSARSKSFNYAAVGLVLAALLILAGVLITVDLNKGTIAIESDGDDIPVRIMRGTEVVKTLRVSQEGTLVRVAAGAYTIEVEGDPDSIEVQNSSVTLKRGNREDVRIVQVSSADDPPVAIVMIVHPDVLKNGNAITRRATSSVIRQLNSRDYCGIIHFDSQLRISWLWPDNGGLANIGQRKKEFAKIAAESFADDLPDLPPAISMAIGELKKVDLPRKHIIVFTDGTPAPPSRQIISELQANKISVSIVYPDLFEFGVPPIYRQLAAKTGGNFHYLTRNQSEVIEHAFTSELQTLRINPQKSLEQIGRAFEAYRKSNKRLPGSENMAQASEWTTRYPYSWRVALLPELGETELFNQYRFDEPWDSHRNLALLSKMPAVYRSYPRLENQADGDTRLLGFGILPNELGSDTGDNREGLVDDLSKKILVVESPRSVPWTKPEDLADPKSVLVEGQSLNVLFYDGKIQIMDTSEILKLNPMVKSRMAE